MLTTETINKLDSSNIFEHIKNLGFQLEESYKRYENITFDNNTNFDNVILLGTGGGSSIASKLAKAVLEKVIEVPIVINQGYSVPKWVSKNTLAIALTVSGNTEETIQAFEQAISQKAYGVAITAGGKLKAVSEKLNAPIVELPETKMQARSAIGDLFGALIRTLEKLDVIKFDFSSDIQKTSDLLKILGLKYSDLNNSEPLKTAEKLKGFSPVIYSSDELIEVSSIRWKNQFGENSKVIAHYYTFPEMNHDEVVGWEQEKKLQEHFKVVFLRDNKDHDRNKKRMDVTKTLIENRGVEVLEINSRGESDLERVISLIYFGDWVSIYLAFLYEIDPTPVNLIIEMKKILG
ncbi:MAG: bifunctional phosphoglucose/phosphomannose isomerase [Candidatus Sericytochromatia bacterium]